MNTFKLSLLALAAACGLASCNKANDIEPQAPASAVERAPEAAAKTSAVYQLTKHGNRVLSYGPDGRLQKITFTNGAGRVEYTFGFLNITTKTFDWLNRVTAEENFMTDINTGNATEWKSTSYAHYSFGTVVSSTTWNLVYSPNGRLLKKVNKADADERSEFTFYDNGNIATVKTYDKAGKLVERVLYGYPAAGQPRWADLNRLTPALSRLGDDYLNIFGLPQKEHYRRITITDGNNVQLLDRVYDDTFNRAGYLTKRVEKNVPSGNVVTTTLFEYQVSQLQ